MNLQQRKWYNSGRDMMARAGFSLAMCGALAAVVFVTERNSSDGLSASAGPGAARPAIIVASFQNSSGIDKSQTAIDASPYSAPLLPARIPIPLERVAEASAPLARHTVASVKKAVREPAKEAAKGTAKGTDSEPASEQVAAASSAASFESCLPGCETRDPLIVGAVADVRHPDISPRPTDEMVEEVSLAQRTPSILGRALGAPVAVYRKGRSALTTLVQAAL
jgi:hypothetical protein